MTYRRAISRRRYLSSRRFYTHLDLDQAANKLGGTNVTNPKSAPRDLSDLESGLYSGRLGSSPTDRCDKV
jgi:hypothetical protein